MFRKFIFHDNLTNAFTGTWWIFLMQGILLILLSFIIILMPQLLVAMIAATFMLIGAVFLSLAWKTYQVKRQYRKWRNDFWEPFWD